MLNYNYFALYPVFLIHSYLLKFEQKHYNLINMKNKFCKFIFYAYFCDMSLTAKEANEKTKKFLVENTLTRINEINDNIENCMKLGEFSTEFSTKGVNIDTIVEHFRNLGYRILNETRINASIYWS